MPTRRRVSRTCRSIQLSSQTDQYSRCYRISGAGCHPDLDKSRKRRGDLAAKVRRPRRPCLLDGGCRGPPDPSNFCPKRTSTAIAIAFLVGAVSLTWTNRENAVATWLRRSDDRGGRAYSTEGVEDLPIHPTFVPNGPVQPLLSHFWCGCHSELGPDQVYFFSNWSSLSCQAQTLMKVP